MAITKTTRKTVAPKTNTNGVTKSTSNTTERLGVLKTYKIFINGQFPRTESGRYYPLSLSNGNIVNMCLSSRKDFRNAVVAARAAQPKWASKTAYNRSQILYRIAEMLETRQEQFKAELISLGSTPAKAKQEIETSIDRLIYYAGWCDKYNQIFSTVNPVSSSHFNFSSTEPVGVVAMICDENSALLGLISALAPVIASGNTAVLLASETKALCSVTFAEVIHASDVPAGVVNILTGKRSELVDHFSSHMDVNAVYVNTDDAALKKKIESDSAVNLKRPRIESSQNWTAESTQSPYRIMDYLEVKTTWHPIGI